MVGTAGEGIHRLMSTARFAQPLGRSSTVALAGRELCGC